MKNKNYKNKTCISMDFYSGKWLALFSPGKAQATVFMILAIVILLFGVVYFYVSDEILKKEIAPGVEISLEKVPTEFNPVKSFVTNCLEDTSVDGLRLIGKHGGYISLDFNYSGQAFPPGFAPTETDAVEFAPGSGLRIPYWYYMSSKADCTDCRFESKRPALRQGENSIEKQLSKYVENTLGECLNNFESLKEQGFKIKEGKKAAETKVTKNDVVVILDYQLEVEKEDIKSSINQFFVVLPVNLQDIYNLATKITNMEMENRFLEKAAINLIASFASLDDEKLPPLTDMTFDFGSSDVWMRSEVQGKVTQILSSYIPLFQVYNTRNYNRNVFTSSLTQSLYDDFIIPIQNESFYNLEASFTYLDFWPIAFDMNCNGEFCQPESVGSDLLSFIGIQRYNFAYDVSFPTYVEIKDPEALNNRGYNFNFFLEANLRNNAPLPLKSFPLQTAALSLGSQLCDFGNRNSGPVNIKVVEKWSKKALADVQVTYSVTDETCFIGKTDSEGILVSKFPSGAIGGVVHFLNNDYLKKALQFDAGNKEEIIVAELEPLLEKNVVVKKKKVLKQLDGWQFQDLAFDLNPKEEAMVTLTRISPLVDEEYIAVTSYKLDQASQIKLAPGDYELSITLISKEELKIPEREETVGNILTGRETYTIPGIEFGEDDPYPSGGLELNFTIMPSELESADTIVFYAVTPSIIDIPEAMRVMEDLQEIDKIEDYSTTYSSSLLPDLE